MSHEEALDSIASKLALESFQYAIAAQTLDLHELRDQAQSANAQIARTLGIEEKYHTRLAQFS